MAYSNGRIYVNKSVTPNIGVSIADLQRCFAVVIKATINGQTVRRLSGDLGVICSKKTGDTFTVDGVTWQVESRAEINPWARYRPIPCYGLINNVENNKPTPISDSIRAAEQYGIDIPIDLYKPDLEAGYNDYVDSVLKYGEYWLPLLPFRDDRWKRLTDFAKTNDNDTAVGNVGYDHNAKPDEVKVTITGGLNAEQTNGVHFLEPLVPAERRWIVIPPGSTSAGRYPFPNDHLWMDMYYQKIYGTLPSGSVVVNRPHPEWLSPIDLMSNPEYGIIAEGASYYTSVRRRLVIYRPKDSSGSFNDDPAAFAGWKFWAYVTDTTTAETGRNLRSRPYNNQYKNAWVDFTENGNTDNAYLPYQSTGVTLGNITGRILVVDCWVGDSSSQNIMPIPGYTYELYIDRRNIQITVDIDDTFYFWYVEVQEHTVTGTDTSLYDYVLEMYYSMSGMGLQSAITNNTQAISALSRYFESLTLGIGDMTVDLLQNSQNIEYGDGGNDSHHLNYERLECTFLKDSLENLRGQTVTISGKRVNTDPIPAQIKQIDILTGENDIVGS